MGDKDIIMVRFHTVFDIATGRQSNIRFTDSEETDRSLEEAEALKEKSDRDLERERSEQALAEGVEKLRSLSFTDDQIAALLAISERP